MKSYTHFDPNNPPLPLMSGEPGSFALKTMTTRKPAVIQTVLADHPDYPATITQAVQALHNELVEDQPVHPLHTTAPDGPAWQAAWQPHQGKTWLNIPWYFAEAFLYRRLLEAVAYFGDGPWAGVDPFLPRKQAELQSESPWQVLASALSHAPDNSPGSFSALLHHCVWGNRVDLSYNQVAQNAGRQITVTSEQSNLLVDDTEPVLNHLRSQRQAAGNRPDSDLLPGVSALEPLAGGEQLCLDFICDNAGTELLMDLVLTDFLLRFNWVRQITLHVKAHPTYVSDAIPQDIKLSIEAIKSQLDEALVALAGRLEQFRREQRLVVQPHLFWNSSLFFWEIPPPLQTQLAQAHLVIIKGDANYRRLLCDSRWPTTIPITDAVPYFPTAWVALRTMKSDPVVGLQPSQAETLDQLDPEWRVNGQRGMIQAVLR